MAYGKINPSNVKAIDFDPSSAAYAILDNSLHVNRPITFNGIRHFICK